MPTEIASPSRTDYVGVVLPTYIYVLVASKPEFDRIDRPVTDFRQRAAADPMRRDVLVKSVEQDGVTVVFQHWLS